MPQAADAAVAKGGALGPLHGVPFHVKDLVNTKDVRTTFASHMYEHNVPKEDSVSVARLKQAGAILMGKTTTPEFGHMPYTEAPLFGRTRNAWAADRTSGGSSGGAAVALAAGVCPIGIGTDAGGSTRIPAAANGVVGFKQSAGVVPHDMSPEVFANFSSINPMARTVMDTALMLEAMAGQHRERPLFLRGAVDRLCRRRQAGRVAQGAARRVAAAAGQHRHRRPSARSLRARGHGTGRTRRHRRADGRRHGAGGAHLVRLCQRAVERALPRCAAASGTTS